MTTTPEPRTGRASISAVMTTAALFILTILFVMLTDKRQVNEYDEGVILTAASEVARGLIPHRDFYANYGPAQFYILAALFKLFGPSVLIARLWGALAKACISIMAYFLGRRVMNARWATLASVATMIWTVYVENTVWPVWPALLATLASLYLILDVFDGAASRAKLVGAGSCVGIATLFRYDIGFLVALSEAAVIAAYAWRIEGNVRLRVRAAMRFVVPLAGGVSLVFLPVALAFLYLGAIPDLLFDVVIFPAQNYGPTRSLPFPGPSDIAISFAASVVYLPLIVAATLAAAFLLPSPGTGTSIPAARDGRDADLVWPLLLFSSVMLCFFVKGIVRVSPVHMAMSAVVACIVLASLIARFSKRTVHPVLSLMFAFAALATVIPTVDALVSTRIGITENARWLLSIPEVPGIMRFIPEPEVRSSNPCSAFPSLPRIKCYYSNMYEMAVMHFLKSKTHPGDMLFVGVGQHDRIFANNVSTYFLLDLQPATKWYHFDPGLQTTARIQELMINDLERTKPKYIVLDGQWDFVREHNASSKSSGVTLLDEFIRRNYATVAGSGAIAVLELRGDKSGQQ